MNKTFLAIALATTLASAAQAASVHPVRTLPGSAAAALAKTDTEDLGGCGDPLLYKSLLAKQGPVHGSGSVGQQLPKAKMVVCATSVTVGQS